MTLPDAETDYKSRPGPFLPLVRLLASLRERLTQLQPPKKGATRSRLLTLGATPEPRDGRTAASRDEAGLQPSLEEIIVRTHHVAVEQRSDRSAGVFLDLEFYRPVVLLLDDNAACLLVSVCDRAGLPWGRSAG